MGHLTEKIRDGIFARLESDLAGLTLVEIRPALVRRVPSLVTKHPLRGYDAIHLAAALLLRDQGAAVDFWASDVTLQAAARAEGLRAVVPT
jgi:predicted nucleic acid-binding protein